MTALTEVLTKHQFRAQDHSTIAYRSHCYCGWWEHTNGKREVDVHAVHVEAELTAAGIVAVQLPAGYVDDSGAWWWNADGEGVNIHPDVRTAEDLRREAANALAAANAADPT